MSSALLTRPRAAPVGRPGTARLLSAQLGYAVKELWRTRVVLIFTFVLPMVWLVIIGLLAGNEVVDESSGLRVMQFVTPAAIAMGVLYAAYPTVAIGLATAREQGILKRLRGTPLPLWVHLAGRIGGAVVFALGAVSAMLVLAVVGYDVQIVGRTLLATVVTLALGIACFAAIGLAVAALARSAALAQEVAIASAVALTFVSDMFTIGGDTPVWLSRVGSVFPLKHLVHALQDQFDPFSTGAGWDTTALAVLAAWLLGAVVVAVRAFRWDPATSRGAAVVALGPRRTGALTGSTSPRPGSVRLLAAQTRWADRAAWRDPGWVFFAVAMPVGLYALMCTLYGDSGFRPSGQPFTSFFAAGMAAYGAAVTAFINMPEAVATARDQGVLKRLRGTPLPPALYLAGRALSVLWISLLTAAAVLACGVAFFDVDLLWSGLPLALLVLTLGTASLAACGLALASVVRSAKAVSAVGLALLLPLSFVSDVFLIGGDLPDWMSAIGSLFPLKHFVWALVAALDAGGPTIAWGHLGALLAWLVAAGAVAARRFRWEAAAG